MMISIYLTCGQHSVKSQGGAKGTLHAPEEEIEEDGDGFLASERFPERRCVPSFDSFK